MKYNVNKPTVWADSSRRVGFFCSSWHFLRRMGLGIDNQYYLSWLYARIGERTVQEIRFGWISLQLEKHGGMKLFDDQHAK